MSQYISKSKKTFVKSNTIIKSWQSRDSHWPKNELGIFFFGALAGLFWGELTAKTDKKWHSLWIFHILINLTHIVLVHGDGNDIGTSHQSQIRQLQAPRSSGRFREALSNPSTLWGTGWKRNWMTLLLMFVSSITAHRIWYVKRTDHEEIMISFIIVISQVSLETIVIIGGNHRNDCINSGNHIKNSG